MSRRTETRGARLRLMFVLVLVASALLLTIRAGTVPLLDPDEARFAQTSVEMLESGDLVVPHFKGEPRLAKPPLLHWIQSFVFSVLGVSEWSARLHSALATVGSIVLVGWIAGRRFGPEAAVWAAAVFITMPLVFVAGRLGTLDSLVSVHVLAAVTLDVAAPDDRGAYRPLAFGGLTGLAFLAKGPVGVVLPLLVILAGRTVSGRNVLPSLTAVLQAAAAWCVVVLPWGLAFLRRIGGSATLHTLRTEVLDRFFAGTAHVEPAWYYAKIVAVGFLPWLAPFLIGIGRAWRLRRSVVARTAMYSAAGFVAGTVLLSLSRGKVANYLLPLAPLAAILVTWELGREIERPHERTVGPTLVAATVAALAALMGLSGALRLEGALREATLVGAVIYGVGAAVAFYGAVRRRPRLVYGSTAASAACLLLAFVLIVFPSIGQTRSAKALIEKVPQLASGRPVVTVELRVPSLTFYLGRPTEVLEMSRLEARMDREDDPLFVFADVDLPQLPSGAAERLREVGRQGKFRVFAKRSTGPAE